MLTTAKTCRGFNPSLLPEVAHLPEHTNASSQAHGGHEGAARTSQRW